MKAFEHYDVCINRLFEPEVRTQICQWTGDLAHYKFNENVWTFFPERRLLSDRRVPK